jgi:hypothetical protein
VEFSSDDRVGFFGYLRVELNDEELKKQANENQEIHVLGKCSLQSRTSSFRRSGTYRITLRWSFEAGKWQVRKGLWEERNSQDTLPFPDGAQSLYPR